MQGGDAAEDLGGWRGTHKELSLHELKILKTIILTSLHFWISAWFVGAGILGKESIADEGLLGSPDYFGSLKRRSILNLTRHLPYSWPSIKRLGL
jgi:hypothetical protein